MTQRKGTGRMRRAAAWLLVTSTLYTLLPVSASTQSSSTTASVDFTSGAVTWPVPPVDPDQPEWESPLHPDRSRGKAQAGQRPPAGAPVAGNNGQAAPAGESGPIEQIPGVTGSAGWLSINYVTPLNYSTEIDKGIYTVQQQRPYLQTSDLRGTASGWKVTAIAGPFQNPGDMAPAPALLSFRDGSPNSAGTYLEPPDIPDKIELPANGRTQRLVEFAHENEGVGIWVVRWYPGHGAAHDFQLRLFSPISDGRLGFVLWVMNDAP